MIPNVRPNDPPSHARPRIHDDVLMLLAMLDSAPAEMRMATFRRLNEETLRRAIRTAVDRHDRGL